MANRKTINADEIINNSDIIYNSEPGKEGSQKLEVVVDLDNKKKRKTVKKK